jgi:hypothetical protein
MASSHSGPGHGTPPPAPLAVELVDAALLAGAAPPPAGSG